MLPALHGEPVAWFSPTYRMLSEVWRDATRRLHAVIERSNAQEHRLALVTGGVIDMWSLDSPDVARGRKYVRAIIDEAAMVPVLQDAWEQVIRSTLADYRGDAWFLSTPRGFNHFHDLYQMGQNPDLPEWASWRMPTHSNPHIPADELAALERELPSRVYRQEILALFEADVEGALWLRAWIDEHRATSAPRDLARVVVGVDPSGSKRGDEVGIITAALDHKRHGYVLADDSCHASPDEWATRAVIAWRDHKADRIVAEANFGGEMVESTIRTAARKLGLSVPVTLVHASRGKAVRAEPIAALYQQGLIHHVGTLTGLENELCGWRPLDPLSPGRLDALVWALTDLAPGSQSGAYVAGGERVIPGQRQVAPNPYPVAASMPQRFIR